MDRFFADYAKAIDILSTFPKAGRAREDLSLGLRSYPVYPYIIFHRVLVDVPKIVIVSILHAALDTDEDDFSP